MADTSTLYWFDLGRRLFSVACMLWLASRFGRSLYSTKGPLIEQIARVSSPDLAPSLQRYARRLTWLWSIYFLGAAFFLGTADGWWSGAVIASSSLAMFVGENWLRPCLFPHQTFPGVLAQVKDTWCVWRNSPSSVVSHAPCSK